MFNQPTDRAMHDLAPNPSRRRYLGAVLSTLRRPLAAITLALGTALATLGQPIPGQYIAVFKDDVADPGPAARQLEAQHGLEVRYVYRHSIRGFAFAGNAQAAQALARNPRIAYVEQDQLVHTSEATIPTGVSRIGMDTALLDAISPAGAPVDARMAIIDTGLDRNHPDLNVDLNGVRVFFTTVKGRTQIAFDNKFDDDNGHGTHVGGTAAANGRPGGIVGVAPGALLTAVKVLGANGSGNVSLVIAGVDWVAGQPHRFDVANMSLGGGFSQASNDAVRRATDNGIVFVVSAGNGSTDVSQMSPASEPSAITVSAMVDYDGAPGGLGSGDYVSCWNSDRTVGTSHADEVFACFSNYGEGVDICAPGVWILSTWPTTLGDGTGYHTISGTSMAAPHVAGAAALYVARNRAIRSSTRAWVDQVAAALTSTGWQVGDYGYFDYYTADNSLPRPTGDKDSVREPLLNVSALLEVSVRPDITVTLSTPTDGDLFESGARIGFSATASRDTEDLTDRIVWTSNRDGVLGFGGTLTTSLSEGTHTMVASVPDPASTFGGAASITIISGPYTPTPRLFVTISFDKPGEVPVYRDGETMWVYFDVADEQGEPVPQAEISSALKNPLGYTIATVSGTTDANGRFEAYRKLNSKRDGGTGSYLVTGSATKTDHLPSAEVRRSFQLTR
jgi:hypothetical protein